MKTFKIVGWALLAVFVCLNFSSCSNDEEGMPENAKEYLISVGLKAEVVDIEEEPLSRNATQLSDLYAIQVYSSPASQSSYHCYAYGLFNDPKNIVIKLLEGYKYRFVAVKIIDGVNMIAHTDSTYSFPMTNLDFGITQADNIILNNKFTFITNKEINLAQGWSVVASEEGWGKDYQRPNTDRFYGEMADFVPQKNTSIEIDLKRVSFGVKFKLKDFKEGAVQIKMENSPLLNVVYPADSISSIIAFESSVAAFSDPNYYEEILTTLDYVKGDGVSIPLGNLNFKFKRNKLTTITVKIKESTIDGNIGFNVEQEELEQGDHFEVENGEIIDSPIVPTPEN